MLLFQRVQLFLNLLGHLRIGKVVLDMNDTAGQASKSIRQVDRFCRSLGASC